MRFQLKRALFFIPVLASTAMISCDDPGYPGNRSYSAASTGHGNYSSLPRGHSGDSYYYDGRYHTDGRYESGRFLHQGRSYSDRYYHHGQYLYGGTYYPPRGSGSQYNRYSSLPSGYAGASYYHDGRYCTGGRYETGRFSDHGRSYSERYFHDGNYLYGGTYRQHSGSRS